MLEDRIIAVTIARRWLGTPWKLYGRTPLEGLDCVGFIACLGRAMGYYIPEPILDGEEPYYQTGKADKALYLKYANIWGKESKSGEPEIGDILLFHPTQAGWASIDAPSLGIYHNALFTGKSIIHLTNQELVEEDYSDHWDVTTTGIFAFKGYE